MTKRQRMGSRLVAGVAAVVLTGLLAEPAAADQTPAGQGSQTARQPARPYRGLFGAGTPAARGGHALDLTVSVYQEYGNNQNGEIPTGALVLNPGWFMGVEGGLFFQKVGQHTTVGLRGDGAFRYYQDIKQTTSPRYRAALGIDTTSGRRRQTTTHVGAAVEFEPYYVLSLFSAPASVEGAAILPTSRDDLLYTQRRQIYSQSFSLEHQLTARSTFSLSENVRYTKADTPGLDVRAVRASARYGYRLSRYAALRLGYGYQVGGYGLQATQQLNAHDIDLSLDYRRPLTRSRRTTVGFGSGSSLVTAQPQRQWRIVGVANLRHELGAGWFIQGDFARNVQLVEGFTAPFFVNTVTGSLGGFMGRRVELLTSGAYSRGDVGFSRNRYNAIQGSARLRLALARFISVSTEGLVYSHHFDARIVTPEAFPPQLSRWTVRWNVALWLPLSR